LSPVVEVVALGITTEGVKIPLGLWEGSTDAVPLATAITGVLRGRSQHHRRP
jgi:hypothetical protein